MSEQIRPFPVFLPAAGSPHLLHRRLSSVLWTGLGLVLVLLAVHLLVSTSGTGWWLFLALCLALAGQTLALVSVLNRRAHQVGEARFRALVEHWPCSMAVYAPDGQLILANRAFRTFWGVSDQQYQTLSGSYNILADPQLIDSSAMPFLKAGFAGRTTSLPPLEYELPDADAGESSILWVEGFLHPVTDPTGRVLEVVLLQQDVSERQQVANALQQRQRELESLLETNRDLSSVLELDELLMLIARRAAALLETDSYTLFRLDAGLNKLQPVLSIGEYASEMMAGDLDVGVGITGTCVAENRPILANDAHLDPRAAQVDDTPEYEEEHMMAAPLSYHGEATGAILISRLSDRPFSQSDFEVFIGLTQQAAVAIHNAQMVERIQDHAADLEGRVAERTAELAATNQHLEAMARVKDEFVSNVSHELRTPITSIKLYHSLLDRNPTRREHYMATLHRETERLQHIVEDLLNLSRLSKDAWPLSQEPVDLNQLARTYVDDRRSLADSRGLRLTIQEQPDLPPAGGEAGQLGQALGVLLTNALNYTPNGGEVRVSTRLGRQDDRTWLQLSVRDSGPGIGAEEQPQIFERFFRGSAARASGAAGTGLGLAIARQIVERHGGRIELSGPGLDGAGACFSIWLPAFQGEEG